MRVDSTEVVVRWKTRYMDLRSAWYERMQVVSCMLSVLLEDK